jgi:hypothetical protein
MVAERVTPAAMPASAAAARLGVRMGPAGSDLQCKGPVAVGRWKKTIQTKKYKIQTGCLRISANEPA